MRVTTIGTCKCSNCGTKKFFSMDTLVIVTNDRSEELADQQYYYSCRRCCYPNFLKWDKLPRGMTTNGFSA